MKSPAAWLCITLFVALTTPLRVNGWLCLGHMLVAEIARLNVDQKLATKLEKYARHLSRSGPFPQIPTFTQSACWPDDLKEYNLRVMNGWHYTGNIHVRGDFTPKEVTEQRSNVVSVIDSLSATLKRSDIPMYARSFALSFLVHCVGDIHQPLHSASMMSKEYPKGDLGGNLVFVQYADTKVNLHFFWDNICGVKATRLSRPLNPNDSEALTKRARELMGKYPASPEEKEVTDGKTMSAESFNLVKTLVYSGIDNNTILTESYVKKCTEIAEQRIALGGYRLARLLEKTIGAAPQSSASGTWAGITCVPRFILLILFFV
uniref:Uncharacterized protein TCIL3000_6_1210 n=1 Tax=Trypanosoma congolense (strain IL3000) TaxID=1068625 RepID=G0UNC9_TRYCI|nr:unnamed protein product [Trypanosoma congolense IL3000]